MVGDYVTSIVSQLGASAFEVREIVLNAVLEALEAFWQAFIECLTNLTVSVIDREMTEQMVFNGNLSSQHRQQLK